MKMSRFVSAVVFLIAVQLIAPIPATHASTITLLDGQHAVWGDVGTWLTTAAYDEYYVEDSYHQTSSFDPVSGLESLRASAGFGEVSKSSSWATPLSVGVAARSWTAVATAYAEGYWLFQPHRSTFELRHKSWNVYDNFPGYVELRDETTDTQLFYWEIPFRAAYDEYWVEQFALDTTHIYSMSAHVMVAGVHDGPWDSSFQGSVIPVPGALLLAGLGAGLVGHLRRRRAL